ncbi:MAG: hypothetical protein M1814_001421 [Vezdaea aestivalis]|nr:MAG: hypothetical protein M1814_001421 [Vezdaea aestivalis]
MSSKYSSYYPSAPASGSGSLGAYRARSNTQSLPEFGFTIKNINMDVSERRNNGEHWWPPQMSSAYTDIDSTRSFWYTPQTQNNASHWYECNPPQWSQLRSTQTLGRLAIASVFWYNPTRQFLALNADATTEDETPECWREIRFRKPDEVQDFQSHADFTGSYQSLMSKAHPEARWPGHLLPEAYNYVSESLEAQSIYHENNSQEPPAHGISGNLAILFAIVGFTGPRGRILEILQHSCEDQVWRPHNFEDDR